MRLPNGYGSVTKLSGKRRRPYIIKKTTGYNDKGHPILAIIGYAETKTDGLQMLAEYNKNPYDIEKSKITVKELFEKYALSNKFKKFAPSSQVAIRVSFNKAEFVHDMIYRDVKAYHMQEVVDESGGYSSQGSMRTFFKHLDDYAHELDVCNNKYSQLITTDKITPKKKSTYTKEEIDKIWDSTHVPGVDDLLILLYTGFRISEFLELEVKNIDFKERIIKGGNKTDAGKNRIVPIHPRIQKFIENKLKNSTSNLLTHYPNTLTQISYQDYRKMTYDPLMQYLGFEHVPHETRHTFRSQLDSAGGNKVSIDLLMGHSSSSVGEKVYTHKTLKELRDTIELLS